MKELRFLIIKRDGDKVKFLRHEGHKHYWTTDMSVAMEYTKIEVAQDLAAQNKGEVCPVEACRYE